VKVMEEWSRVENQLKRLGYGADGENA